MPMNFLGRTLFPNQPAWRAKRQARQIFAAFMVALIFGMVVAVVIWFTNAKH